MDKNLDPHLNINFVLWNALSKLENEDRRQP